LATASKNLTVFTKYSAHASGCSPITGRKNIKVAQVKDLKDAAYKRVVHHTEMIYI
jgi:hypothetical protein